MKLAAEQSPQRAPKDNVLIAVEIESALTAIGLQLRDWQNEARWLLALASRRRKGSRSMEPILIEVERLHGKVEGALSHLQARMSALSARARADGRLIDHIRALENLQHTLTAAKNACLQAHTTNPRATSSWLWLGSVRH